MESKDPLISTEFLRFARLASEFKLEYLVIGGLALNLHKILRNTIDSDIWLNPTESNLDKLKNVLIDLGYEKEEIEPILHLNLSQPNVFVIDGPIDFLTHVHRNFQFEVCFAKAAIFHFESIPISVLNLSDLRELKILVRREQDLRDVIMIDEHLKKLNNS